MSMPPPTTQWGEVQSFQFSSSTIIRSKLEFVQYKDPKPPNLGNKANKVVRLSEQKNKPKKMIQDTIQMQQLCLKKPCHWTLTLSVRQIMHHVFDFSVLTLQPQLSLSRLAFVC